jgi:microcystin-dependent protein
MPTPILGLPYPVSADTADVPRDIKALADALDPVGTVPVGALMLWPTAISPVAWLLCDGHQVLASDYPKLAAVLGSAGGQITLPNFADRFPIGPGQTPVLGAGGVAANVLALNQLPAHNHAVTDPGHTHAMAIAGNHGHNLNISSSDVVDPAHRFAVAGGVAYTGLTNVTLGSTFILPTSTADNWHGEVGSHGHIGSTAQAAGDHAHAVTATVSGISTQNAGAGAAVENRPPFLAVNFIIRAL